MKLHDIVLVRFPFSDLSKTKLRPAVVVAVPGGDNIILCQITTKSRSVDTYGITLLKKHCSGDIRFDSNIYVDMVFTLHKNLIDHVIGKITTITIQKEIKRKLGKVFA